MQPNEGGQDSALEAIPVMGEKFSISKKLQTQDFVVEKRWVTKTVSVPVSMRYEEIYVNGKRFGSGLESALSSLKGAVKKEDERARLSRKKARLRGEQVPLYDSTKEEILSLFGEEVIVSKRMRQVGEVAITKRKVTETKKVSVNVKGESVIVRHPDGNEELVQEKPFTAST